MKLLKIKASNLHEALAEARVRLGDEATVLHAKQLSEPGLFGLIRRNRVEVVVGSLKEQRERTREDGHAGKCDPPLIPERFTCTGPLDFSNGQIRLAVVGPSGVGKTTVAAKVAARYTLGYQKKVALVTLDSSRVGAAYELEAYANVIGVPMERPLSTDEADDMLARHVCQDMMIIDTAGVNHRDRDALADLEDVLRRLRPTETHLVISASSNPEVCRESIAAFGSIGANRIIMTKFDECPRPWALLNYIANSPLPFSFLTAGRDMLNDLILAEPGELRRIILEGAIGKEPPVNDITYGATNSSTLEASSVLG